MATDGRGDDHLTADAATSALRGTGRIPELDGLRGIAIGLVLVWHYFVCVPVASPGPVYLFFQRLFFICWSGVDLFFVLSGFLIGGILLDNRSSPRYFSAFYTRRAFRILPPYLVLILSYWAARGAIGSTSDAALQSMLDGPIPTWSYPAFVQNFFMASTGRFGSSWMSVTWSIAIEEQFYLVLPTMLLLVPRRLVPGLSLALASFALGLRTWLNLASTSDTALTAAYVLLPSRMDGLFLGVLGAWLVREAWFAGRSDGAPGWLRTATVVLGAGVLASPLGDPGWGTVLMSTIGYSWLALFYLAVLLVCLKARYGPLRALLSWTPLRALGRVSYFVYLFHVVALGLSHFLILGRKPDHATITGVLVTALALGLVLLAAAGSWRYLEKPLTDYGRTARY